MRHTQKSLLLFGLLFTIVVFFLGLNIGKQIQGVDNTYVPPAPTVSLETSRTDIAKNQESLTYEYLTLKSCRISLLIPSSLKQRKTPENEFEFSNKTQRVFISCNQDFIDQQEETLELHELTGEKIVANQTVTQFIDENSDVWMLRNTARRRVLFETHPDLTLLIEQTLAFE